MGFGHVDAGFRGAGGAAVFLRRVEQRYLHGRRSDQSQTQSARRRFSSVPLRSAIIYVACNWAYYRALPFFGAPHRRADGAGHSTRGGGPRCHGRGSGHAGGAWRGLMAAAIMISTFGCTNGMVMAGARVYYAMAKDGLFFPSVGKVHPQVSYSSRFADGPGGMGLDPDAYGNLQRTVGLCNICRGNFLHFDHRRNFSSAPDASGSVATLSRLGIPRPFPCCISPLPRLWSWLC